MKKPPAQDPPFLTMVACMLFLLALGLASFSGYRTYRTLAVDHWPLAAGEVLKSAIYHRSKSGDWCLQLTYRYQVDGKSYRSINVGPFLSTGAGCHRDKRVTERLLARMQPGAPITVRYDPATPSRAAVFTAGLDLMHYFLPAVALAFGACGVITLRDRRCIIQSMNA